MYLHAYIGWARSVPVIDFSVSTKGAPNNYLIQHFPLGTSRCLMAQAVQ